MTPLEKYLESQKDEKKQGDCCVGVLYMAEAIAAFAISDVTEGMRNWVEAKKYFERADFEFSNLTEEMDER